MVTIEEAKAKAEKQAIEANLQELMSRDDFASANIGTKRMQLALACGLSQQAISQKLEKYEIRI